MSGTDGAVLQSYDYRENGEKTASTSLKSDKTWVGGLSVNDDTGDSGLYLMGHRHYDATLGRFLSRDPIGFAGGLNLYSYGNSPVQMVDPEGLFSFDQPIDFFKKTYAEAKAELTRFGNHLRSTASLVLPRVGMAADLYEYSTSSGDEGDASGWSTKLPFFKGATGLLARALAKKRVADNLNRVLRTHLSAPPNHDCIVTAIDLRDDLKAIGVPSKFFHVKTPHPGIYFGDQQIGTTGEHLAVKIGDRIFDKLTGPSGLPASVYKEAFKKGNASVSFKTNSKWSW